MLIGLKIKTLYLNAFIFKVPITLNKSENIRFFIQNCKTILS